jgi:hypothetical protein
MNARRWKTTVAAGVAMAVVSIGVAAAATDPDPAEKFTGCLGTTGTRAGKLAAVAEGSNPQRACTVDEKVVHLGSGDITSIRAKSGGGIELNGDGLTGGFLDTGGQVQLGLGSTYRLPQACEPGQVPQRDGEVWSCATLPPAPKEKRALLGQHGDSARVPNNYAYIGGLLRVPAGTWALTAKVNLHVHNTGEGEIQGECHLDATDGHWLDYGSGWDDDGIIARDEIFLQSVVTRASEFNVGVACQDSDISDTDWYGLKIMAVEADSAQVVNL